MYVVMLFFQDRWFKEEDYSAENALTRIQGNLPDGTPLTFRPADGTVYVNFGHIPSGVVFQQRI